MNSCSWLFLKGGKRNALYASSILLLVSAFLIISPAGLAQPGVQERDETFSRNRKFVAQISETEINKPMLTVFKVEGEQRTFYWNRALVSKEEEEDANFMPMGNYRYQYEKLVSNDGNTAILRARHYFGGGEQPAFRVLTKKGVDQSYTMEELLAPVDDFLEEEINFHTVGKPLELLLDEEEPGIYVFWESTSGKWVVVDLESAKLLVASGEQEKRLNAFGLEKAREVVREHQPDRLKRALTPLKRKAAEMIPGIIANPGAGMFREMPAGAYRFLAKQQKPEDKGWIGNLLKSGLDTIYGHSQLGTHLQLHSEERALGDQLLAKWEGKTWPEEEEEERYLRGPGKYHYLGGIGGEVRLPFVAPDKAGLLFIYLIPAEVPQGSWDKHTSVQKVSYSLERKIGGFSMGPERVDQVGFTFDTLEPGAYRVKAVWDRRPPHGTEGSVTAPSPGDYESAESKVFELDAGHPAREVVLECTNRVGKADEYFAADEIWRSRNPPEYEEEQHFRHGWSDHQPKVLLSGELKDWLIKTNHNKGELQLKRIRLMEGNDAARKVRRLEVEFVPPAIKREGKRSKGESAVDRFYQGTLADEHGCRFESSGSSAIGRRHALHFDMVPYGSRRIELEFRVQDMTSDPGLAPGEPKESVAASFVLTNHFQIKAEEWKEEKLPARRELDLVAVELPSFNPLLAEQPFFRRGGPMHHTVYYSHFGSGGPNYVPRENKFVFTANGKPASGWRKLSGRFSDRWGNEGYSVESFCKEEEIFKYEVRFARDVEKGQFLPEEKWELPIKKVPGAGESLELNATKEIQGKNVRVYSIGGTGEFTYRGGELLSATNEVEEVQLVPHFFQQRRGVQPKIYIKPQVGRPAGFPGSGNQEVTIASKIPHLVCRLPESDEDNLFAVLEQDTGIEEPTEMTMGGIHYYPGGGRPRSVRYLPLDMRPDEAERKITVVVQQPREAEFLVKVPKRTRN